MTEKLAATDNNLAYLIRKRDAVPRWEPGKRAALTRQINGMRQELAAAAKSKQQTNPN